MKNSLLVVMLFLPCLIFSQTTEELAEAQAKVITKGLEVGIKTTGKVLENISGKLPARERNLGSRIWNLVKKNAKGLYNEGLSDAEDAMDFMEKDTTSVHDKVRGNPMDHFRSEKKGWGNSNEENKKKKNTPLEITREARIKAFNNVYIEIFRKKVFAKRPYSWIISDDDLCDGDSIFVKTSFFDPIPLTDGGEKHEIVVGNIKKGYFTLTGKGPGYCCFQVFDPEKGCAMGLLLPAGTHAEVIVKRRRGDYEKKEEIITTL